ncbi:MAG TPA: hypothetical protein VER11_01835 [Polyangiaceae bacterium]|nr:hypothetical protein [Polyangiaceae bacterium]
MNRSNERVALLLILPFALACGSSLDSTDSDTEPPVAQIDAPKYSELFAAYFAAGTPGHCATVGCHADPGHTVWRCGPTKDDCYAGMTEVGLIDPASPTRSAIVDPHRSPLTWLNPAGGNMPLDAPGADAAAAEALRAWVAAGAQND